MDPVDKKALKGKFKSRTDKDIDNDGDVDSSDEYLHKRRQAVSKAIGKVKESVEIVETHFKVGDEVECIKSGMEGEVIKIDPEQKGKYYTVKREDGKVMKYAPDELRAEDEDEDEDEKEDMDEEVEVLDESKALLKDYQTMKAQGKKDHNVIDALMSMPKYKKMSRDQMAKVIGDAKRKGIFKEDVEVDEAKKYDPGHIGAIQRMLDKEREAKKAKGKTKKESVELEEKGKGLWHNIHQKRKRGEAPAQPGDKDYPSQDAIKRARKESFNLEEKLNVSDGMGAWIDDFKKSDAPQFKGKSDKERREMAIAAYLSAKRSGR